MQAGRRNSGLFLLVILFGIALRIFHLDHSAVWLDEKVSLAESNGCTYLTPQFQNHFTTLQFKQQNTFSNVVSATIKEDGGNGILYILKLHYWQQFFGSADFSVRMLSLIFSCLVIIISYYFSLNVFNSQRSALSVALLISLHPLMIEYAQKVRPYSMAMLFSFVSSYFFYRLFIRTNESKLSKINIVAYSFFSLCAMFSHYLTAYIFLAQGFYFLIFVRGKSLWVAYIAGWLCVIAIFISWMLNGGLEGLHYMSLHNAQYTQQLDSLKEGENMFILHANFKNVFLGWMQMLLAATGNTLQGGGFRLRLLTVLLIIPILLMLTAWRKKDNEQKNSLIFLFILVLSAPIYATVLALIAAHTISFQPAYGIFAAPYIMMLVGYGCEKLITGSFNKLYKVLLTGSLVLVSITSLYFYYRSDVRTYSASQPNPLIALAEKIEQQATKNDTVIFSSFADAVIANIYLKENVLVVQVVDTSAHDKVILKNTNTVLFDFENGKYRY